MSVKEIIFLGLPGPTHNYAGLAAGNLASMNNAGLESSPKMAALQVLNLAEILIKNDMAVGIVPFQPRPDLSVLAAAGFSGKNILTDPIKTSPELFAASFSSSAMWVANAGIFTSAKDSTDKKNYFTVANLFSNLHRSIEAVQTYKIFKQLIFPVCEVIQPLPATEFFSDEGAANHIRLADKHSSEALNIFVYGKDLSKKEKKGKFSARQSLQAMQAIARRHKIKNPLFIKQNPEAIDAGVFHNDVIALANENVLLYHEKAFENNAATIKEIKNEYKKIGRNLITIEVKNSELSLKDAVETYFFNSQIVTTSDGMLVIAPVEVKENKKAKKLFEKIIDSKNNTINKIEYVNLRESMRNGGGPACLRLRILLNENEIKKLNKKIFLTKENIKTLKNFIEKYYPDNLKISDLVNSKLVKKSMQAALMLEKILNIKIV